MSLIITDAAYLFCNSLHANDAILFRFWSAILISNFTLTPAGEQSIAMSVSVGTSARQHVSGTTRTNYIKFSVHVVPAAGSWSFSFVADMFSHDGHRWHIYDVSSSWLTRGSTTPGQSGVYKCLVQCRNPVKIPLLLLSCMVAWHSGKW